LRLKVLIDWRPSYVYILTLYILLKQCSLAAQIAVILKL